MKRVYFVRHGESESNRSGVVQGHHDSLSEEGRRQATLLSERFRHMTFGGFITSDVVRARQTADIVASVVSTPLEESVLFREVIRPTSFIGQESTTPGYAEFLRQREEHYGDREWHFEDEENFYDTKDRTHDAIAFLESYPADTILVVTHGHFLRFLVGSILLQRGLTPDVWRPIARTLWASNAGITLCTYDQGNNNLWQVLTWNDHAHFAE